MKIALSPPLGLAIGILVAVALGSAYARADEVKMPSFATKVATPPTLFLPPPPGADTLVAFGGRCMDQKTSNEYAQSVEAAPIMSALIEGTEKNTVGLFAVRGSKIEIWIGTGTGKVCLMSTLTNITFFDQNGQPVQVQP